MINRICDICSNYTNDTWTLHIKDDKESCEFSGHLNCVKNIQDQMNEIDGHKKSVKQILKELKLTSN